jgi:pentose-5-phosphate-3-epimerase
MKEPAIVASVLGADFADDGCDTVLVHAEARRHLHRTLSAIRSLGIRSGVAEARRLIERSRLPTLIEVDGGISATTAPGAVCAGAQLLVAGSAILAHPEGRPAAVAELRRSLQPDLQAPPDGRAELESDTYATGGIHGNPDKAG